MNSKTETRTLATYSRYAAVVAALLLASACDISVERGPTATFFFRKGTAEDLRRCPPKSEADWHQAEFEFDGLHHEFVSPLGLICVKDEAGKYVGTYVSAANSMATHQLEEGGHRNFFNREPVFKARTRQPKAKAHPRT